MKLESCSPRQNPLFYISVFVNILLSYYILSLKVGTFNSCDCITRRSISTDNTVLRDTLAWQSVLQFDLFKFLDFHLRLNLISFHLYCPQPEQHVPTVRVPLVTVMANSNPDLTIIWTVSMSNKWKFQKIFPKIHLIVRKLVLHSSLTMNFRFRDRHGNIRTRSE